MSILTNNSFEAVYYSFPVPNNPLTVNFLGILFDKIYLPGVYLPKNEDKKKIKERIDFLVEKYNPNESLSAQKEMIGTLLFIHEYSELIGVFEPTGKWGQMGVLEEETKPVVLELENLIYGPPPPNFFPTPNLGFNQPAGNDQINAPSWISYPANALVYSQKNNLPLISDSSFLPIPNYQINLTQTDANTLASYLMASSFSLVLPKIRPLKSEEILEIRYKFEPDIQSFRMAMLSGVNKYVELIGDNPTLEQMEKQAKFIAQTYILPKAEELKLRFENPGSIAVKKLIDLTLEAPELALNFQNPQDYFWAGVKVFNSIVKKVKEGVEQYQSQNRVEKESGLSLLLKVQRSYPAK